MIRHMGKLEFREWLESEMKHRGMTQAGLVKASGLNRGMVSMLLSGERNAGRETADKIARAFNLPPENVYRIAGLIPKSFEEIVDSNPSFRELYAIMNQLSLEDQAELLRYARFRLSTSAKGRKGEA